MIKSNLAQKVISFDVTQQRATIMIVAAAFCLSLYLFSDQKPTWYISSPLPHAATSHQPPETITDILAVFPLAHLSHQKQFPVCSASSTALGGSKWSAGTTGDWQQWIRRNRGIDKILDWLNSSSNPPYCPPALAAAFRQQKAHRGIDIDNCFVDDWHHDEHLVVKILDKSFCAIFRSF